MSTRVWPETKKFHVLGDKNTAIHVVDDSSSTSQTEGFTSLLVETSSSGGQVSADEEVDGMHNARLFRSAEASTSGQDVSTLSDTSRTPYPGHRCASVPSLGLQGRLALIPSFGRELTVPSFTGQHFTAARKSY